MIGSAGGGTSFHGLAAYLIPGAVDDRAEERSRERADALGAGRTAVALRGKSREEAGTSESDALGPDDRPRVLWTEIVNVPTAVERRAATYMAATAMRNVHCEHPVYHLVVAFDPDDAVTRARMREAALRVLRRLGLEEHQAILVAHGDTRHPHVHLMVNRVHPMTGVAWDRWQDYPKIEAELRAMEREWGLRVVPGKHAPVPELAPDMERALGGRAPGAARQSAREVDRDANPAPATERETARRPAELDDADRRPSRAEHTSARGPARTRGEREQARRTGEVPLVDRARAVAEVFRESRGWDELTARLAAVGLRLERRERGLVVTDGATAVKASRVGAKTSMGRLGARFGASYDAWAARLVARPLERAAEGSGDRTPAWPADRPAVGSRDRGRQHADQITGGPDAGGGRASRTLPSFHALVAERAPAAFWNARTWDELAARLRDDVGLRLEVRRGELRLADLDTGESVPVSTAGRAHAQPALERRFGATYEQWQRGLVPQQDLFAQDGRRARDARDGRDHAGRRDVERTAPARPSPGSPPQADGLAGARGPGGRAAGSRGDVGPDGTGGIAGGPERNRERDKSHGELGHERSGGRSSDERAEAQAARSRGAGAVRAGAVESAVAPDISAARDGVGPDAQRDVGAAPGVSGGTAGGAGRVSRGGPGGAGELAEGGRGADGRGDSARGRAHDRAEAGDDGLPRASGRHPAGDHGRERGTAPGVSAAGGRAPADVLGVQRDGVRGGAPGADGTRNPDGRGGRGEGLVGAPASVPRDHSRDRQPDPGQPDLARIAAELTRALQPVEERRAQGEALRSERDAIRERARIVDDRQRALTEQLRAAERREAEAGTAFTRVLTAVFRDPDAARRDIAAKADVDETGKRGAVRTLLERPETFGDLRGRDRRFFGPDAERGAALAEVRWLPRRVADYYTARADAREVERTVRPELTRLEREDAALRAEDAHAAARRLELPDQGALLRATGERVAALADRLTPPNLAHVERLLTPPYRALLGEARCYAREAVLGRERERGGMELG